MHFDCQSNSISNNSILIHNGHESLSQWWPGAPTYIYCPLLCGDFPPFHKDSMLSKHKNDRNRRWEKKTKSKNANYVRLKKRKEIEVNNKLHNIGIPEIEVILKVKPFLVNKPFARVCSRSFYLLVICILCLYFCLLYQENLVAHLLQYP